VSFPDSSKSSGFGRNLCTIPAAPAPPGRQQMRRLSVDETREGEARGAIRALKRGQPPERRSLAITHYPPTRPGFIMAVNQVLTSLKRQQF
jgi:hypothetical protein